MFYWQCRCVKPTYRYDHMKPIHTHFPLHVVLCIGQVCRRVIHRPLFASPHLQQDNILVVSVHSNCLQRQASNTYVTLETKLPKKDYRKTAQWVSEKFLQSLHSTTLANSLCIFKTASQLDGNTAPSQTQDNQLTCEPGGVKYTTAKTCWKWRSARPDGSQTKNMIYIMQIL